MPFPYVTADAVTAFVAGQLHTDPANLTTGRDDWATLVTRAVVTGANDVRARYLKAGYSLAAVEGSDQLAQYVTDQAAFWAATWAGLAGQIPETVLKSLDRREELEKMPFLTIAGAIQAPAPGDSPVGGISHGHSEYREFEERHYDRTMGEPRRGGRRYYDPTEADD